MKTTPVVMLLSLLALLFGRTLQVAGETNQPTFFVCQDGRARCRILVANSSDLREQALQLRLGQQLQVYIHKLSGVVVPVEGGSACGSSGEITGEIALMVFGTPASKHCYQIEFARTREGHLLAPPMRQRVRLIIYADTAYGLDCGQMAISNFVEKVFGPPLSALDDPNYKWPHKPTLVIDVDKFETIQYPPDTHEPPRYLETPKKQ